MNRTEFFSELEIASLQPHLVWASLEIVADDVADIQLLVTGGDEDVNALKITCEDGHLKLEQAAYGLTYKLNSARWMQVILRIPLTWRGMIDASTVSGSLRARRLAGTDLKLETVNGTIDADGLTAISMKVVSVSGSIRLHDVQVENLHLRNVSGEIFLTHAQAQNIHINSVSGDTELQLDSGFHLMEANLVSAKLRAASPVAEADASIRSVSGRLLTSGVSIREDGPVVSVTSVSGDTELIYLPAAED